MIYQMNSSKAIKCHAKKWYVISPMKAPLSRMESRAVPYSRASFLTAHASECWVCVIHAFLIVIAIDTACNLRETNTCRIDRSHPLPFFKHENIRRSRRVRVRANNTSQKLQPTSSKRSRIRWANCSVYLIPMTQSWMLLSNTWCRSHLSESTRRLGTYWNSWSIFRTAALYGPFCCEICSSNDCS